MTPGYLNLRSKFMMLPPHLVVSSDAPRIATPRGFSAQRTASSDDALTAWSMPQFSSLMFWSRMTLPYCA